MMTGSGAHARHSNTLEGGATSGEDGSGRGQEEGKHSTHARTPRLHAHTHRLTRHYCLGPSCSV